VEVGAMTETRSAAGPRERFFEGGLHRRSQPLRRVARAAQRADDTSCAARAVARARALGRDAGRAVPRAPPRATPRARYH
jgi:hypothetical protein